MPTAASILYDRLKSPEGQARLAAGKTIANSYSGLADIINAGGLTPQQRAMFSAAMNHNLGLQAEQAGLGLGRRAAAQGIGGTGLANAGLGQVQSGLLSAQQQGEEALNEKSLQMYMDALQTALGITEREKDRQAQKDAQNGSGFGFKDVLGAGLGLFGGKLAEGGSNALYDYIFKPKG